MLQDIIAALIVGIAAITALIYIYRVLARIKRREVKCGCCNDKNACKGCTEKVSK